MSVLSWGVEQGGLAEGLRGCGRGHGSEVLDESRCRMDVIIQVLTLLVSSGIAWQLLYYNSRKRNEAAADKVKLDSLPSITSKLSNITAATTT